MEPDRTPSTDPFVAFRRDHALVLERIDRLEREVLDRPGPLEEPPLRELVAHLERQFATHMAAEDHVLYPGLRAAFPGSRATVDPLLADHAELRHMLAALARLLELERGAARDEQIAVLARDLSDLLRLHIRHEETVVLDVAARVLSRSELEAMAVGLEAWRDPSPSPRAPEGR